MEQTEKKTSLNKNMILGIVGTVLMKVVSLLTVVAVGYLMTASQYGNLSTYNTWITIFGIVVGLQFSGSIQNAYVEYSKEDFHKYCSTVLLIALGSTVVIFLPFVIANQYFSELLKIEPILMYTLIPQCFGSFLIGFMTSYFLAQKKVLKNLIWTLTYAVLLSGFALLLTQLFEVKELGYAIGSFIPNIGMGLFCFFYLMIKSKFAFDPKFLKFAFLFSLPLIMHMAGNVILAQSDKLMIRYMMDEVAMGQYTMVHNYSLLLNSLWMAFNSVFIPYYYDALKENDTEKISSYTRNYLITFSCISFGYILVGREIIHFVISEEYYPGLSIFELGTVAQYLIFLYSFSVNYEFFKKKTIWIAIGTLLTAAINIGLNYIFINQWGIFGAALASAISYLILVVFHEIIARFVVKEYPIKLWYLLVAGVAGIAVCVGSILLKDYWIPRWIIGGLIGVFLIIRLIKVKRII